MIEYLYLDKICHSKYNMHKQHKQHKQHKHHKQHKQLLHKQHNALIVGHSNTIPELARLLCGCFIEDMQETEHDRLIVVSIIGTNTQIKTLQQKPLSQP